MNFEVSDLSDIEDEVERRLAYEDYPTELDSFQELVLKHELKALRNNRLFVDCKESHVVIIDEHGKRKTKSVHIECAPRQQAILKEIQRKLAGGRYAPSIEGLSQVLDYYINSVFYTCEIKEIDSPKINIR